MQIDITFHYPADLMALLIDAIPALSKSKMDVITFFKGAGVGADYLADLERRVRTDRENIKKHEIVREVLTRLNQKGEGALGVRREVLRRVVEFENFSMCWDGDRDTAKARVAEIRGLVNVKDTFTRINIEREQERKKRQEAAEAKAQTLRQRQADLEKIKADFASLFGMADVWNRGKLLEGVLNRLFKVHGISVREAFVLRGSEREGVVEQIDGVIELAGELYLVEMKWWGQRLGPGDVAQHLVRVFNRGQARGIFIAHPGYTDAAVLSCKESLQRAVFVLADLEELFRAVDVGKDLGAYLERKVRAAVIDKNPYTKPSDT